MDKKKIIIIIAIIAVLAVGGIAAFSLLNQDEPYEPPVVHEPVIPDYDHSGPDDNSDNNNEKTPSVDNNDKEIEIDNNTIHVDPNSTETVDKEVMEQPIEAPDDEHNPLENENITETPVEIVTVPVPGITEEVLENIPEEDKEKMEEFLEELEGMTSVYEDFMGNEDNTGETEKPPVEEEPVEDPYVPPTPLTDEEVQEFVNNYLNNFEAYVDMSGWDEKAINNLDKNIELIKNDPPKSIIYVLKDYQDGYATKEEVEFEIWLFLEMGGYGSQEITVQ